MLLGSGERKVCTIARLVARVCEQLASKIVLALTSAFQSFVDRGGKSRVLHDAARKRARLSRDGHSGTMRRRPACDSRENEEISKFTVLTTGLPGGGVALEVAHTLHPAFDTATVPPNPVVQVGAG